MRAIDSDFRKSIDAWLRVSVVLYLSVPAVTATSDPETWFPILLLPMIGCFVFWTRLFTKIWYTSRSEWKGNDSYIKEHYYWIWRKLHPMGDSSFNSFTSFAFLLGRYDDGRDPRLQEIKEEIKWFNIRMVVPFAMVPVIWALGLASFGIFQVLLR